MIKKIQKKLARIYTCRPTVVVSDVGIKGVVSHLEAFAHYSLPADLLQSAGYPFFAVVKISQNRNLNYALVRGTFEHFGIVPQAQFLNVKPPFSLVFSGITT